MDLARRAVVEAIGTGLLVATVVGSGIMGDRLSGGSVGLALLANSLATGAGLAALILALGPLSGAHFNPAVSLSMAWRRLLPWREMPAYLFGQVIGAFCGTAAANLMFGEPAFFLARHARSGPAQLFSEVVATFGLLSVIWATRRRPAAVAVAVGGYITSAYWFTASTSFANPAVTLARAFTDTFTGIRLKDVPGFVLAQIIGATGSTLLFLWLDLSAGRKDHHEVRPDLGHSRESSGAGGGARRH